MTDFLSDVPAEESVLSSMMSGRRVESLTGEEFTSRMRRAMYLLLREGRTLEELEGPLRSQGFTEEELYYPSDVWLVPILPHKPLVEAVADLKRLAMLRALCARVDAWRLRAPMLDYERAVRELGVAIRGR